MFPPIVFSNHLPSPLSPSPPLPSPNPLTPPALSTTTPSSSDHSLISPLLRISPVLCLLLSHKPSPSESSKAVLPLPAVPAVPTSPYASPPVLSVHPAAAILSVPLLLPDRTAPPAIPSAPQSSAPPGPPTWPEGPPVCVCPPTC
ncbi:unnamed protein product [Closterium sp. NIES-53]